MIWEFGGEEIPAGMLGDVERLSAAVPAEVTGLLSDAENEAMTERIEWILDNGVFPVPGSRYEYPWPLI